MANIYWPRLCAQPCVKCCSKLSSLILTVAMKGPWSHYPCFMMRQLRLRTNSWWAMGLGIKARQRGSWSWLATTPLYFIRRDAVESGCTLWDLPLWWNPTLPSGAWSSLFVGAAAPWSSDVLYSSGRWFMVRFQCADQSILTPIGRSTWEDNWGSKFQ